MESLSTILIRVAASAEREMREYYSNKNNNSNHQNVPQDNNRANFHPPPSFGSYFAGVIPFITKLIYYVLVFSVMFTSSVVVFTVFYVAVMPSNYAREPIYFDYSSDLDFPFGGQGDYVLSKDAIRRNREHQSRDTLVREEKNNDPLIESKKDISAEEASSKSDENIFDDNDNAIDHDVCQTKNDCNNDADYDEKIDKKSAAMSSNKLNQQTNRTESQSPSPPPVDTTTTATPRQFQTTKARTAVSTPPLPPTAILDLLPLHTQWTAHTIDVAPFHQSNKQRFLIPKTHYHIHIALTLPESHSNVHMGMFMVQLDLYSHQLTNINMNTNTPLLLATSKRPVMFPYQSFVIQNIRKLLLIVPILLGAIPEAKTVVIPFMNHYVESENYPMRFAKVQILVPPSSSFMGTDGQMPQQHVYPQVQVFQAELRIGKEFNWMQSLLNEWFWTCASVGILVLLIGHALLFVIIKSWYRRSRFQRRQRGRTRRHGMDTMREEEVWEYDDVMEGGEEGYDVTEEENEQWRDIDVDFAGDDRLRQRTASVGSANFVDNHEDFSSSACARDDDEGCWEYNNGHSTTGVQIGEVLENDWENTSVAAAASISASARNEKEHLSSSLPDLKEEDDQRKPASQRKGERIKQKINDHKKQTSSPKNRLGSSNRMTQKKSSTQLKSAKLPTDNTRSNASINISSDASRKRQQNILKQQEKIMADRVMKGLTEPYVVFTGEKKKKYENCNAAAAAAVDNDDDDETNHE